jgi:protein-tyrosine kinase
MNAEVIPSVFPSYEGESSSGGQSIGDIIRQTNNLSAEQVESILRYQRDHGVKFGEAAVALGFAKQEDVLWALSQQFHYPYANKAGSMSNELVVAGKPFSDQAEIFRGMRSHLINTVFSAADGKRRALAVISSEAGDGKTFFTANMAVALSQLGGRTVLIDADLRSPRQHEIFKLNNSSGLSSILSGRSEGNVLRQVDEFPSLFVMPVGVVPPNPLELLQRPAFGLLMNELVSKFDHVIVDTPSASLGIDARVIGSTAGAVLAVARKDKTRSESLHILMGPLQRSATMLVGVVMNEY